LTADSFARRPRIGAMSEDTTTAVVDGYLNELAEPIVQALLD
jgi:hypothetical protein